MTDPLRAGGKLKALAVKRAILNAFEKVGGEDYLVMVAKEDPKTFCALLARLLPAEVKADITGRITLADLVTPGRLTEAEVIHEN